LAFVTVYAPDTLLTAFGSGPYHYLMLCGEKSRRIVLNSRRWFTYEKENSINSSTPREEKKVGRSHKGTD